MQKPRCVINYELFINNLNSIKEKFFFREAKRKEIKHKDYIGTMHNKDKVIIDKKLPHEYNIANIILGEIYNKGIINISLKVGALIIFNN